MSSTAKTFLASSMKKLYGMREAENMTENMKENIFGLLQFCKILDAKTIMDSCKEFIVNAFEMKDLIKKNLLKDHPEIALDILQDIQYEKDHISIARFHTKIKKVR